MTRLLLAALLAGGCEGRGEETATDTGAGPCEDAPLVTWENFGQGLVVEHCQPCHASGATERHGAPEEVVFDTLEDVRAWKERILARATGEAPTMPPAVALPDRDREMLEIWLTCWD